MRLALPTVLVLISLVLAATAPASAAASAAATQDDGLAPAGVTVHVDIQGDGDARWTISARYVLNDSSSRAAFEDVAAEFERGQGSLGFSLRTFEQVVPRVADRTGRDMTIQNPEWTSAVRNESGVPQGHLQLSFTWTNFANVRNETVTLGGAFAGGWFGDLGPDQTLVIVPPPGFDVSSAQPSHETVNGTLRWSGPVEFGPSQPVARFDRQPTPPAFPWASIAGAVLTALVIGGIIAYAWFWRGSHRERSGRPAASAEADESEPGATETAGDAAGGPAAGAGPTQGGGQGAGGDEAGGAAGGEANGAGAGESAGAAGEPGGGAGEPEPEPEPELLSDEERVERLLEEHGGRMKQAKIVEETRWSNAKVSQLLSQMADEGRVEKLRIGRENLISLPDDEPGDGSP